MRPLNRNLKHTETQEHFGGGAGGNGLLGVVAVVLPFMVIVYKGRHRADLNSVSVIGRVFKQTIIRVE